MTDRLYYTNLVLSGVSARQLQVHIQHTNTSPERQAETPDATVKTCELRLMSQPLSCQIGFVV
jgi:hypothetical protein